jgi:hypothetical protein
MKRRIGEKVLAAIVTTIAPFTSSQMQIAHNEHIAAARRKRHNRAFRYVDVYRFACVFKMDIRRRAAVLFAVK